MTYRLEGDYLIVNNYFKEQGCAMDRWNCYTWHKDYKGNLAVYCKEPWLLLQILSKLGEIETTLPDDFYD